MSLLFETYPASAPITGYAQVALEQGVDIAPDGLTYGIPAPISDLQLGERGDSADVRPSKAEEG